MSTNTTIEWTDATWNPVRGCTKISPGCKHCYAETFAERFRGVANHPYERGFDVRLVPEMLAAPLTWRKPRHVFVNSMSDLFHEDVPDSYVAAVFDVMARAWWHRFQVLTKRADRMLAWFERLHAAIDASRPAFPDAADGSIARHLLAAQARAAGASPSAPPAGDTWPLPNVGLGVSVEDRVYGLPRIELLRRTPAALRTLSIEPLLEDLGELDLAGIGWVLVGGESGHRARPCDTDWIRSIVRQCHAQGATPFVKQLGRVPLWRGARLRLADRKGKSMPEWPPDLRIRERPSGV